MAQLHVYLPDETADRVRERAVARGLSVSRYLAEVVAKEIRSEWPVGFFERVVGAWAGTPLERAPQGEPERREALIARR